MEIGSIYEINPETVTGADTYNASAFRLLEIEKYNKKNIRFTASGREAIALALKSLLKNRPGISKRCLLPAYMCDTVFFPFEHAGWEIHFYHIEKNLEADEKNLCDRIASVQPGLLFIHPYYGIDTWKSLRPLLKTWQQQGICIMEDVTQSYYLRNAQWEADYVIGSLRKWYPVPDGGFAASNDPFPEERLSENRKLTDEKLALLVQKWSYLYSTENAQKKKEIKDDYLQKNRALEAWLDCYDGIGALSRESMKILSSVNEENCRSRRNVNYNYLRENLGSQTQFFPIPFEETSEAAPLYFPVYVQDREDLQKFLIKHEIYAPVLWPIGKENADHLTQAEGYIYDHILALPVDQRYGQAEMQHMAEVLKKYEKERTQNAKIAESPDAGPEVIAIRADANDIIATGHIMRCITIARQLQAKGKKVLFFTADEYPHHMLAQAGMEYVCLHTDWNQMEEEITVLGQELKKYGCKKLLADSYQVTKKYFDNLKTVCKIIYIDDCFDTVYPADMIINYNAYHVRFPYEEAYKGKARLLLGTAYVPLREEFQTPSSYDPLNQNSDAGRQILVSSGGGDQYSALCGILSEAIAREECSKNIFHVVVGRFNKHTEELEQLAGKYPNIHLHYNVTNMAELMGQCTIAISAAGTMLFELCAMQIPTIFFVCADNQQYDSDFFAREERMLFAGDIRTHRKACLKQVITHMETLLNDLEMQTRMKRKLHEVTDGKGALRIAEEIINL